jgi:hypothetical protein
MSDLRFQDILPVAGDKNPKPVTIPSAATVAPTTFLSVISGTVAIATITPPVSGAHMLCFIATAGSPTAFVTTGNVATAVAMVQNVPCFLVYNPVTAKYYGK